MSKILQRAAVIFLLLICVRTGQEAGAQTWAPKMDVPLENGIDAVVCFSIGDKVYFAGGAGSKAFFEYNTVTDTWTQKADVPGVTNYRAFGIGFAINGKGYVALGGEGAVSLNDLWQYDAANNTWIEKAEFPGAARTTSGSFVIGSKAYVVGGITAGNSYTAQVWAYDATTNTWAAKATLPYQGVAFPFTFAIDGKGYTMGGDVSGTESPGLYQYDPALNSWIAKEDFPGAPRQAGATFVLNGIAYCGLGMAAYDTMFADFFKYDPAADSWSDAGVFDGGARAWPTVATVSDRVYVGTGWDFITFFNDWWELTLPSGVVELGTAGTGWKLYPNSVGEYLYIERDNAANKTEAIYSLYNMTGQKLRNGTVNHREIIDVSTLPEGIYLLEVTDGGKKYCSKVRVDH